MIRSFAGLLWHFVLNHLIWSTRAMGILFGFNLIAISAIMYFLDGSEKVTVYMFLFYINFMFPMMNLSAQMGLKGGANGIIGNFSSKYFHVLPLREELLILVLAIAQMVYSIPFFVLWFFLPGIEPDLMKQISNEAQFKFNFFNMPIQTAISIFLALFCFSFSSIAFDIESTRKNYSRGKLSNALLWGKGMLRFMLIFYLGAVILAASMILDLGLVPLIIYLSCCVLFYYWRAIAVRRKEELSFWSWKRDFVQVAILPVLIGSTLLGIKLVVPKNDLMAIAYRISGTSKGHLYIGEGAYDRLRDVKSSPKLSEFEEHPSGITPLMMAAFFNRHDLVRSFIDDGVDIEEKLVTKKTCEGVAHCSGMTALHFAALGGSHKVIAQLIKAGARIDSEDERGRSPIHVAAYSCRARAVAALIKYGADVEQVGWPHDRRPIHLAAQGDCLEASVVLVGKGAKQIPDKTGKLPRELTRRPAVTRVLDLFESLDQDEMGTKASE